MKTEAAPCNLEILYYQLIKQCAGEKNLWNNFQSKMFKIDYMRHGRKKIVGADSQNFLNKMKKKTYWTSSENFKADFCKNFAMILSSDLMLSFKLPKEAFSLV